MIHEGTRRGDIRGSLFRFFFVFIRVTSWTSIFEQATPHEQSVKS